MKGQAVQHLCRCAALIAGLALTPVVARSAAVAIDPAWSWNCRDEVVWAAPVGPSDAASLLVATRRGMLQLVDAETGRPRLARAIQASPGVQLATPSAASGGDTIVCFDRFALHAIGVKDDPGLRWRHGSVPRHLETFPDDPEVLDRWIAAAATDAGVVALNRDGTLVVLSPADGAVRLTEDLGRVATAQIHIRASSAAVLWKQDDTVRCAFVDLAAERPTVEQRPLEITWPVYSALAPEGLVCVTAGDVTIVPARGEPRPFLPDARLHAATIDVAVVPAAPRGTTTSPVEPQDEGILLVSQGVRPAAYSLASLRRIWPRDDVNAFGAELETLRAAEPDYVATNAWGAFAGRLADGRVLATSQGVPHELLAAHVTEAALYALYQDAAVAGQLRLQRVRLQAGAPAAAGDSPASAPAEAASAAKGAWFTLAVRGDVRHVVWGRSRVAVLLPRRVLMYKLP